MPRFTRVKDRSTGHEYSVVNIDPDSHIVLDKPAEDSFGRPFPAKPHISKGGAAPAKPATKSGSTPEKKEAQK